MSIRAKIILITSLALAFIAIAEAVVGNLVIMRELDATNKNLVESEINFIDSQMNHNDEEMIRILWNKSTDAELEQFMKGENPDYWPLHWDLENLQRSNLDVVIIMDLNGTIIQEGYHQPNSNQMTKLPEDFRALFSPGSEILDLILNGRQLHGVVNIQEGTINLACNPITGRSGNKTNYGYLIVGRWIDADLIRSYGIDAGGTMEKYSIDQSPPEFKVIFATLPDGVRSYVHILNDKQFAGYLILMNPMGEPEVLLRFIREREFITRGVQGVNFRIISTIMIGLLLLVVYSAALEGYVIRPLTKLREELVAREKALAGNGARKKGWRDDISGLREPIQHALEKAQNAEISGQRKQALYSSLVDQASEGFALFDYDTFIIKDANPAYYRMTGLPEELGEKRTLYELFREAGQKFSREELRGLIDTIQNGKTNIIEFSPVSGGNQKTIEISISVVEIEGEKNIYVLLRDISRQKQLENELQQRLKESMLLNRVIAAASSTFESDEIFEMVCRELAGALKLPQIGIGLIDKKNQIVKVVAEYCALGVPPSKGIEFSLNADPSIQKFFETKRPIFVAEASKDPMTSATYKLLPNRKTVSAMVYPLIVQNETVGLIALESLTPRIFTTREKALAENVAMAISRSLELNRLYLHLQNELDHRRKTEIELKLARDKALEASQEKSKFLATMSHEIRTPLNAIIGMMELLQDTSLNPEQREYSYIAQDSAHVLLALMNDILDFSKIEAGKIVLDAIEFDLVSTVESAVDLFAIRAQQKGLEIYVHISPRIPHLLIGDPIRIKQVLLNLVSNAVKFTEHGEIFVDVQQVSQKAKMVELRISVQDTGIGIAKKAQKQLFKPFIQADGSMTRKYGGTGLGLEISRRLVELMGGRIAVESRKGSGSDFQFTIKLERAEIQKDIGSNRSWKEISGMTLVILTESEKQKAVLKSYLKAKEVKTIFASTINQLRKVVNNQRFSKMDGFYLFDTSFSDRVGAHLARQLFKETGILPKKAISFVPMNRRDLEDEAVKLGFGAVLFKPVKMNSLYSALSELRKGYRPQLENGSLASVASRSSSSKAIEMPGNPIYQPVVLLVEDNDANLLVASAQLQKLGCLFDIEKNGKRAVWQYEHDPSRYDLILMDCQMPDMDGYEATKMIREIEQELGRQVPVIAMTAHVSPDDKRDCLSAGMDDYIGKPVKMEDLKQIIQKWSPAEKRVYSIQSSSPTQKNHLPILDAEVQKNLDELQNDGDANFRSTLFATFLKQAKQDISMMNEGVKRGNVEMVRKAAHTLKGSSATIGGARFSDICRKMEILAKQNDLEAIKSLQEIMLKEFKELREAIKKEVGKAG